MENAVNLDLTADKALIAFLQSLKFACVVSCCAVLYKMLYLLEKKKLNYSCGMSNFKTLFSYASVAWHP